MLGLISSMKDGEKCLLSSSCRLLAGCALCGLLERKSIALLKYQELTVRDELASKIQGFGSGSSLGHFR